jgi:hypothetical protein
MTIFFCLNVDCQWKIGELVFSVFIVLCLTGSLGRKEVWFRVRANRHNGQGLSMTIKWLCCPGMGSSPTPPPWICWAKISVYMNTDPPYSFRFWIWNQHTPPKRLKRWPQSREESGPTYIIICKFKDVYCLYLRLGVPGSVVGWGATLQAGRSRVRFLLRLLDFSIDLFRSATLRPCGRLSL